MLLGERAGGFREIRIRAGKDDDQAIAGQRHCLAQSFDSAVTSTTRPRVEDAALNDAAYALCSEETTARGSRGRVSR